MMQLSSKNDDSSLSYDVVAVKVRFQPKRVLAENAL